MKQHESAFLREVFLALASRQIQVFDPRMWPKGTPPAWLRASDVSIKGVCWRNQTGALPSGRSFVRFGIPGSPDIMGMFRGGQPFGFEVKTDKGTCSEYQLWWHSMMSDLGMKVGVVRGFEDTVRLLAQWGH